jgi:hypothetical protein
VVRIPASDCSTICFMCAKAYSASSLRSMRRTPAFVLLFGMLQTLLVVGAIQRWRGANGNWSMDVGSAVSVRTCRASTVARPIVSPAGSETIPESSAVPFTCSMSLMNYSIRTTDIGSSAAARRAGM